ncbi:MAG: hypothetical protein ACM3X9_02245 [Bacillota bacterium]
MVLYYFVKIYHYPPIIAKNISVSGSRIKNTAFEDGFLIIETILKLKLGNPDIHSGPA